MNESQEANDMTLDTLLSVARDIASEVPEDLLRRVFALQRAHQFDTDGRVASLQDLQHAIDDYIGQSASNGRVA